jgi:hypothetical protein
MAEFDIDNGANTRGEPPVKRVNGYIVGPFGIDKRGHGVGWCITHLKTGLGISNPMSLNGDWQTLRDAADVARALAAKGGDLWNAPHLKFQRKPSKKSKWAGRALAIAQEVML